jgi:hypothetical protein
MEETCIYKKLAENKLKHKPSHHVILQSLLNAYHSNLKWMISFLIKGIVPHLPISTMTSRMKGKKKGTQKGIKKVNYHR